MTARLRVEGLSVPVPMGRGWGIRPAPVPFIVQDVSLEVGEGETLGIVGESGSGKTTLGRAIIGLVRASAGTIALDGETLPDLAEASFRKIRRSVGLLFQNPTGSFNPRMRVASVVAEPWAIDGVEPGDVGALLQSVGLPAGFARRFPHELSGGQARRVALARALAAGAKTLIADEPTAGLDVSVQGEILNRLLDLKRERGLSLLFITHNLPVIRHAGDRIAVMYLGRIVETGPTAAVTARPAHPYTAALLAAEPLPDPTRRIATAPLAGEVPSLFARPPACEFHPRCPRARALCRKVAPAAREIAPGRIVACHDPIEAP